MKPPLFDRVLVQPTGEELQQALQAAADAANAACRVKAMRLPWPPDDFAAFEEELESEPEGFRQWNGKRKAKDGVCSFVLVLWWTDHAGRKHFRIIGQRENLGKHASCNWLHKEGVHLPPLALVYPHQTFVVNRGKKRAL